MKRKSMSKNWRKSSSVSVSAASSKTNLSQTSKQINVDFGQGHIFPTETPSSAHDSNTLSTEKLELPIPGAFDLSKTQYDNTMTHQSSSPQEKDKKLSFPKQSEDSWAVIPDSPCQTVQDCPDVFTIMSSESTPTPPGSGSPQLDQLLSDLKEMKLRLGPETLDPSLSESTNDSPEVDQIFEFQELPLQGHSHTEYSDNPTISGSSVEQLGEDNHSNAAVTEPAHFQAPYQVEPEVVSLLPDLTKTTETSDLKDSPVSTPESLSIPDSPLSLCEEIDPSLNSSFQNSGNATETFPSVAAQCRSDLTEKNQTDVSGEDFTTDTFQSQAGHESSSQSIDSQGLTEESNQDRLPHLWEAISDEPQNEDFSLSDLTPETVRSSRSFSFEELMPYSSSRNFEMSSDEDRPGTNGHYSAESLTPVDYECFASESTSVKPKTETKSSTSDEEYSMPPGYAQVYISAACTDIPPGYSEVVCSGSESPTFEYSDPEPYFDCKQGASDFSETEPDEPEARASGGPPQDHPSLPRLPEKGNGKVLLSSGSEHFEDDPFVHEPLRHVHDESEEFLQYSEASDEEFTL
ncbi:dentin sialophosphoprotein-like isoform X2 [Embiotoca jacksoni]